MYKIHKILVPVDFSSCSRSALSHALSLGAQLGATLHVIYVTEVPEFRKEVRVGSDGASQSLRDYAQQEAQLELKTFLASLEPGELSQLTASVEVGSPRGCILEQAQRSGCDLIVMGTHGRTGRVHSLAGSVAESVVRLAPCPVLTVRDAG